MKIILLVDSCSDLPLSFIQENKDIVDTIAMPINLNDKDYFDDFGKTLTHKKFYNHLKDGIVPTTAQINSYMFYEKFKHLSNEECHIIYIGFSSGLSGTYNNAVTAKNMVLAENSNADISVIDSKSASVGEGVLVIHAVNMLRNNSTKDEIVNWIEQNKLNSNHWFAVNDLIFLKKGGRISSTSAAIGTILNVKPILTLDDDGKLKLYTNIRGRKKSLKFLMDKFKQHTKGIKDVMAIVGHGCCLEDALEIKTRLEKEPNVKEILISELGATIASHVGPGMISVAFIGDKREKK